MSQTTKPAVMTTIAHIPGVFSLIALISEAFPSPLSQKNPRYQNDNDSNCKQSFRHPAACVVLHDAQGLCGSSLSVNTS